MADTANSVIKSKFIARYGPMRAGFGVKQADVATPGNNNRFWTDIDGTQRPMNTDHVITLTAATRTLLPSESGALVLADNTVPITVTLPPLAVGLEFTLLTKQVGTGTGHTLRTNAGTVATMKTKTTALTAGAAITNLVNKGISNATAGGGIVGDSITFRCDGTIWWGTSVMGSWIQEP